MEETKMDHRKISFISCVNNHQEYNTALSHIRNLHVPDGYHIETIAIENASSITSGYNRGMKQSNAKYKVYLHQDTNLLNKDFINEIITLFQKYPQLGMLGAVGAKGVPNYHDGWPRQVTYGGCYHTMRGKGHIDIALTNPVQNDYEKVLSIDGLMMATQYDLEWREDLFKGWHLYDISQSLEFIKAGYDVGVPKQTTPWCFHDCGTVRAPGYVENWNIFTQHYKDVIQNNMNRLLGKG
jgi:hypothetical protein